MIKLSYTSYEKFNIYNLKLNFIGYIMGDEWLNEARAYFFDGYKDPYLGLTTLFGEYINRTIVPDSKNVKSIQAYAVFLEKSEEEVKAMFDQMASKDQ